MVWKLVDSGATEDTPDESVLTSLPLSLESLVDVSEDGGEEVDFMEETDEEYEEYPA